MTTKQSTVTIQRRKLTRSVTNSIIKRIVNMVHKGSSMQYIATALNMPTEQVSAIWYEYGAKTAQTQPCSNCYVQVPLGQKHCSAECATRQASPDRWDRDYALSIMAMRDADMTWDEVAKQLEGYRVNAPAWRTKLSAEALFIMSEHERAQYFNHKRGGTACKPTAKKKTSKWDDLNQKNSPSARKPMTRWEHFKAIFFPKPHRDVSSD